MKIIYYTIERNEDLKTLQHWVNDNIKKGLEPIGGLVILPCGSSLIYYQTMVKYEYKDED